MSRFWANSENRQPGAWDRCLAASLSAGGGRRAQRSGCCSATATILLRCTASLGATQSDSNNITIYTTNNIITNDINKTITSHKLAMARFATSASSSSSSAQPVNFGRSGYNKDGSGNDEDDSMRCFGRSGYNKDGSGDDEDDSRRCFGRSGYNKDGSGDDEDDGKRCFGRSGYN
ncbi:hypothetical protein GGR56DRAFT_678170 [Xylariaceae sp. FL0804]|nr:hypothetical protein GGR56DRAFT_678170 [Xylariaceae sp. FL0804]